MNVSGETRKRWVRLAGFAPFAAATMLVFLAGVEAKAQPAPGDLKTVEGKVRNVTTAPRGEVDGVVLDDGTVVHWPPHLEDRFSGLAAKGERIRVCGRMETGPEGDTHLEVQTLTNLRSNDSRDNDDRPPPARRGLAPDRPRDRQQRLRELQDQVEHLRREIARLRREG